MRAGKLATGRQGDSDISAILTSMIMDCKRKVAMILTVLDLVDDEDEGAKRSRGKTRQWVKRREERGLFENIVTELTVEDSAAYREMMRMKHEDFLVILNFIEKDITPHQIIGGNTVINAKARLTLALRFLATGETFRSLAFQFRISRPAISYIVTSVCQAIIKNMEPVYLKVPSSEEEWLAIANKFYERWQFPNCIGAIDGKHLVMQPPPDAGSKYYNYKHTHSVVLMAIAGPDYECIYADVGTNGRVSDGGIWNKSSFCKSIENGEITLPPPSCLPFGVKEIPYVLVADDAFALKPTVMKPYPQAGLDEAKRIYNYRHSRARRISENLFGIIANRWRVFRSVILLPPTTIEYLTMATLTIHNFLRQSDSKGTYCPSNLTDNVGRDGETILGHWQSGNPGESMLPLAVPSTGHNASMNAKEVRDCLKDFFCNEGAVEWQWEK